MSDRLTRILSLTSLAASALALLFLPTAAQAWGPLAHLSFSTQALAQLGSVPNPTRALLSEFANEFLYGSLAADIVVGKNLARHVYHCHNWRVGFKVLRAASADAERAFALGFLAHLAADTVAHNYFVPFQTTLSFARRNTRHAYWELRYDQEMDRALSQVARVVSSRTYRAHDELLRRTLRGASVLPFSLSRSLFGSLLASARQPRFQTLSRRLIARQRQLPLTDDLLADTNSLAVEAILGLLCEGKGCRAASADAIGAHNLLVATRLRKALARGGRLLTPSMAAEVRESFRRGIQGPLVLPPALARLAY